MQALGLWVSRGLGSGIEVPAFGTMGSVLRLKGCGTFGNQQPHHRPAIIGSMSRRSLEIKKLLISSGTIHPNPHTAI